MSLDRIEAWGKTIGLYITIAVAVSGGLFAAVKFAYEFEQRNESERLARRFELRKPYLEKQLAIYMDTLRVTSKIATKAAGVDDSKEVAEFFALYYTTMAMFSDETAIPALMREFAFWYLKSVNANAAKEMGDYQQRNPDGTQPLKQGSERDNPALQMRATSAVLARTMRIMLEKQWNAELQPKR